MRLSQVSEGYGLEESRKAEVIEALEDEVFGEEDESTARRALADFSHGNFTFSDSWEIKAQPYTYHFLWCLHAIVWGIQQYDAMKILSNQAEAGKEGI